MKCPHCGHEKSRVMETRVGDHADRRIRICQGCGESFRTLERVAVYAGQATGYIEVAQAAPPLEVVPPAPAKPKVAKAPAVARYKASVHDDRLVNIPPSAQMLIVHWWNSSRWSKHRAKATWTEAAWEASVRRVAELPTELQHQLAQAGVEHGWQALKVEYLDRFVPSKAHSTGPNPTPTDPAMREALASW
jgi:hypothetical protein